MRWTACAVVCVALVSTSARAMDLLDQWRAPEDVWFARVGPAGDGGRSGLLVTPSGVLLHGPRGAPVATVPRGGPRDGYIVPSDDGRYFAIVTRQRSGVKSASTTLVRVYGPDGAQVATHSWRVEYDDSNPPFEVSGVDGTLAITPIYTRDPHLLRPNGTRVDFAPTELIRDVDFARDTPLIATARLTDWRFVLTVMDMQGATLWEHTDDAGSPKFVRISPDGSRMLVGGHVDAGGERLTTTVRLLASGGELYRRERTGARMRDQLTHKHTAEAVAWSDDGGMVAVAYTDSVSVLAAATGATVYEAPLPSEGFGPRMAVLRVAVNERGVCAVLAGKYERLPGVGSVDDIVDPELMLYDELVRLLDRQQFATRRGTWSDRRGANVRSRREPVGLRRDLDLGIGETFLTVRIAADEYRLSLD